MLAGQAMQSKLINPSEIINNGLSCENKDHRHRKLYDGIFFAVVNPTQGDFYEGIAEYHHRFPWLAHMTKLQLYTWHNAALSNNDDPLKLELWVQYCC